MVMWIPRSVPSTIAEKVGGFNNDFSCPPAPRFDKTTIWANTYVKSRQHASKNPKCVTSLCKS